MTATAIMPPDAAFGEEFFLLLLEEPSVVVCWSVVYGVVSKSMRDSAERERAA